MARGCLQSSRIQRRAAQDIITICIVTHSSMKEVK